MACCPLSPLEAYKATNFTQCPKVEVSYFATPQFLSSAATVIAINSTLFNFSAFYCILFKTPKVMSEMKWCLFNLQVWTYLLDLIHSVFYIPFYFFPAPALCSVGLLSKLGVPRTFNYSLQAVSIGGLLASMLLLFENRHQSIVPIDNKLRINSHTSRFLFIIFNFCLGSAGLIPCIIHYLKHDDKTEVSNKFALLKIVPCPDPLFFDKCTFKIENTTDISNYALPMSVLILMLEIIFFISHCTFHLYKGKAKKSSHSKKSIDIKRQFFIASCVQTSVPTVALMLPVWYMSWSMLKMNNNKALMNMATLMFPLHGFVATIALIMMNKSYRSFAAGIFELTMKRKKKHINVMTYF